MKVWFVENTACDGLNSLNSMFRIVPSGGLGVNYTKVHFILKKVFSIFYCINSNSCQQIMQTQYIK